MRLKSYPYIFLLLFCLLNVPLWAFQQTDCELNAAMQGLKALDFQKITPTQFNQLKISYENCFKAKNYSQGLIKLKLLEAQTLIQEDKYTEAFAIIRRLNNKCNNYADLHAEWTYLRAVCMHRLGKLENALEHYKTAITLFQNSKNWEGFAYANLDAADVAYLLDLNFRIVVEYLTTAHETASKHLNKKHPIYKYVFEYYGAILFQEGNFNQSIKYTQKSIDLTLTAAEIDSNLLTSLYYDMGLAHEELMDFGQALNYYQLALPLFKAFRSQRAILDLYRVMGDAYRKRDEKDDALKMYRQVRKIGTNLGWDPIAERKEGIYSYKGMAQYYRQIHRPDSLLAYLLPKLPSIERYKLDISTAYKFIGYAYEQQKEMDKAELYMRKTLENDLRRFNNRGPAVANDYLRLSILYDNSEQKDKSLVMLDSVIGALSAPSKLQKSTIEFEHAMDHQILKNAYRHRGEIYFERQAYDEAHENYELAISLLHYLKERYASEASKQYTVEALRPLYEAATHAALQLYKTGQKDALPSDLTALIFEYAENSKATLLNESILKFRSHYHQRVGIPDSILIQEEFLLQDIDDFREELFSASQQADTAAISKWQAKILETQRALETFENQLNEKYPNYRSLREKQHKIASIEDIQKKLDEETILVEYFISEDHSFIFYITKDKSDMKIMENHSLSDLRKHIHDLRQILTDLHYLTKEIDKGYQIFINKAYYLYDQYLKHPLLKNKKRIVLVPDREFNYIPYEVLLTQPQDAEGKVNYQQLPYLLKDYVIRYEYSATVMINHDLESNRGNGRVLAFAPAYEQKIDFNGLSPAVKRERSPQEVEIHGKLNNLEGAQKELTMLQSWADGEFYYNEYAVENTFKALEGKPYSVVHLATHGLVNFEHPAFSSLVFTEDLDSTEDNILYAYEINHLDYRKIELVVLSACQTGYGKYALGEGVVSLGRSFMYAGVASIVSTLWELNDQSSVELMELFYRNLSQGMEKDQALQEAKLEYLESHDNIMAHPFFWAGLVQIGDPSPIVLKYNTGIAFLAILLAGLFICLLISLWLLYKNSRQKQKTARQKIDDEQLTS
jgi:CHAT domain-containing protein